MKTLIFKANQLGDNLIFLPVIQALCRRHGTESVHVITTPTAAPLYEGLLPPQNLWIIDREVLLRLFKHPGLFLKMLRAYRRERFDLALVPFDQGSVPRVFARLIGAKTVVGADNPWTRFNGWVHHRVRPDLAMPMALQDWQLLEKAAEVCADGFGESLPNRPPAPDLGHLLRAGDDRVPGRVLIHPGASRDYKKWPIERYAGLANALAREGKEVIWCEQPGASPELREEVEVYPQGGLVDFIRKLATCSYFVGNNSGPMNLANALGVPSVIFSGPSPDHWDPFWHTGAVTNLRLAELGCQPCDLLEGPVNVCQNKEEPMACMRRWEVGDVLAELGKLADQGEPVKRTKL